VVTFFQTLIDGIGSGAIYALLAVGLTLTFGIGRITNFAHGEVMIFGAMVGLSVAGGVHATLPGYLLAVAAGIGACAFAGALFERALFRNTTPISGLVVSIGLILVLQEAMAEVWGLNARTMKPVINGRNILAGVSIQRTWLVTVATTLIVLTGCFLFLNKTRLGLLWRAMAQDSQAATLLGTATSRYRSATFIVGAALAGVAGGLLILTTAMTPTTGVGFIGAAFAAVIVGGIGDPRGALVGGLIVGLGESFTAVYLNATYIRVFGMLLLVAVLLVRPLGLWGEEHAL
jgi:branched-chain amino acid transport system permease protein